jgi:hypothetical protein
MSDFIGAVWPIQPDKRNGQRHEAAPHFQIAALQSPAGTRLLEKYGFLISAAKSQSESSQAVQTRLD